jgi:hypothetical protein
MNPPNGIAWLFKSLSAAAVAGLLCASAFTAATSNDPPAPNRYIGAKACKNCHSGDAKGGQFEKWEGSKHAKAFAALATPEAKKFAAERKVEDAQKSAECVKCHSTAHGEDAKNIKKGFEADAGVQCESCHGPGENHFKARMAAAATDAGKGDQRIDTPADEIVTKPPLATCLGCHNEKSPTFKPFCFKARNMEIKHLDPRKKRTPEELKAMECACGAKCSCKQGECGSYPDEKGGAGKEAAGKKDEKGAAEKKEK